MRLKIGGHGLLRGRDVGVAIRVQQNVVDIHGSVLPFIPLARFRFGDLGGTHDHPGEFLAQQYLFLVGFVLFRRQVNLGEKITVAPIVERSVFMKDGRVDDRLGHFGIADAQAQLVGLLKNDRTLDQLVQGLFVELKHLDHAVVETGTEALAVLVDQVVVNSPVFCQTDSFTVDRGDRGGFIGPETADAPEHKNDHDRKQKYFDHPAAGMFAHYVEHLRPLSTFLPGARPRVVFQLSPAGPVS